MPQSLPETAHLLVWFAWLVVRRSSSHVSWLMAAGLLVSCLISLSRACSSFPVESYGYVVRLR